MDEISEKKGAEGLLEDFYADKGGKDLEYEDRVLRVGYARMLHETYPFVEDFSDCNSREEAYFLYLQLRALEPSPSLWFDRVSSLLLPEDKKRVKDVWDVMVKAYRKWKDTAMWLKSQWLNAPMVDNVLDDDLVEGGPVFIVPKYRNAVKAVIADPTDVFGDESSAVELYYWQCQEESFRSGYFRIFKEYVTALRLYYELLIERDKNYDPESGERETVIPRDNELYMETVCANRYLRLVDASIHAISTGKSMHNEQKPELGKRDKRLRKSGEPYIFHPIEVTRAYIADVVPFVIEEPKLRFSFLVNAIIAPVHDIAEDTRYSVEMVLRKLKSVVDSYDTSIEQISISAFGVEDGQFMEERLNLIFGTAEKKILGAVLRILSKNTKLTNDGDLNETRRGLVSNIAGPEKTHELLGLELNARKMPLRSKEYKSRGIRRVSPKARTFNEFPVSHGAKMDEFLMRLVSITNSRDVRHFALITKVADRWHNIKTIDSMPLEKRGDYLRETTSRLLAYLMLDWDRKKYPLYNLLPRLIEEAIYAYEQFANEANGSGLMMECDAKYLKVLRKWQGEATRYDLPEDVENLLEIYELCKQLEAEGEDAL